ncbi:MAG: DUF3362 domain-containing protein, partial [Candidatus Accumulibacter sp.]|nr:DUF3362 domain-containing protein [Accumulibacter sp.]
LQQMGRADLIGNGKKQLIPFFQPPGTGLRGAQPLWGKPGARSPGALPGSAKTAGRVGARGRR